MRIALIGNKKLSKIYNLNNYDYIARYNCCDSLNLTYTDKTDLWLFGGDPNIFYNVCNYTNINTYINNNINKKLICHPHILTNIYNTITLDNFIYYYLLHVNYTYDFKLERITTGVRTLLYLIYIINLPLDIYCLDKDRKIKNNWHCYPDIEFNLLDYLEKNNYIQFIK